MRILNLMSKASSKNNPFQDILSALNTDTILVTMDYLKVVRSICESHKVYFATYGAVFDMLRFLEENGCISIKEQGTGEYTITGLYNYGKHNQQI
jgi:hypothetical protein